MFRTNDLKCLNFDAVNLLPIPSLNNGAEPSDDSMPDPQNKNESQDCGNRIDYTRNEKLGFAVMSKTLDRKSNPSQVSLREDLSAHTLEAGIGIENRHNRLCVGQKLRSERHLSRLEPLW